MTNDKRDEALATRAAGATTGTPARRAAPAVEVERSLDEISRWMDGLFRVPGTGWRFGLDAIVGLVPGLGDTATTVVSFYILAAGVRYRVPKVTLLRMAANIAVDYLLGAVPVLGDLFDFAWKSNQMNVELIRRRATAAPDGERGGRISDWLFVGLIMLALLLLLVGTVATAWWILSLLSRYVPSPF